MAGQPKRLSPHFLLREFAGAGGVRVPTAAVASYRALCRDYLEPLRLEFGPVTVTSGFRSLRQNVEVGGAPFSYHRYIAKRSGMAADVVCARGGPRDWYELLDALDCPGLGLYAAHVHADNRVGRARW